MKVSLSWLQAYVDLTMEAEELAHMLTMAGLEVEAIYDRYAFLNSVLVGRIATVSPHPRADRLKICQVEAGEQHHRVVCGAPNAAPGMLAPLALPGTEFIDGSVLTATVIRGERSHGMLCSQKELGLGLDGSGLMVLDSSLTPGIPLNQALDLRDPVLDIDLTPNRPDCLSVIGIAREVAGFQGKEMIRPEIKLPETVGDINDHTSVTIEAPGHCPRYAARLIRKLGVGPSPFWLQDRLLSVGLRPINNLVDITNFVMLETGQPLHAFDFDRLAGRRIVVRTAEAGEKFTTLDEKERTLETEMLMICDGEKPVGIAGVMGGMNSEISSSTTNVLLESAYFSPVSIRKTAKRLNLNTDAAHRFERGVDPHGTLVAIDRAAALMAELGKGELSGGTIDVKQALPQPPVIDLSVETTNRTLGTHLDIDAMGDLLQTIEFGIEPRQDDQILRVTTPSFRVDVSRPQDLMEEVARRWGYDNIPTTHTTLPAECPPVSRLISLRQEVRVLLAGLGFAETINYSFIHQDSGDRMRFKPDDARRDVVRILNPLTEDQAVMRTSLIPGLLETMQRNLARQSRTIKLFESGKIFIHKNAGAQPDEKEMLAGLWTGLRHAPGWHSKPENCDFYDIKGVVEHMLNALRIPDADFTKLPPEQCTFTRPGATAQIRIRDHIAGIIGEVHPDVLDAYDLKQGAYVYEIDFQQLTDAVPEAVHARPLPKYPATDRDATLIVDRTVEAGTLIEQVWQMNQPLVEDVQLFDVFQGGSVPHHRKSVSLRIVYRSTTETLEDDRINQIHKEITDRLVSCFRADLPA